MVMTGQARALSSMVPGPVQYPSQPEPLAPLSSAGDRAKPGSLSVGFCQHPIQQKPQNPLAEVLSEPLDMHGAPAIKIQPRTGESGVSLLFLISNGVRMRVHRYAWCKCVCMGVWVNVRSIRGHCAIHCIFYYHLLLRACVCVDQRTTFRTQFFPSLVYSGDQTQAVRSLPSHHAELLHSCRELNSGPDGCPKTFYLLGHLYPRLQTDSLVHTGALPLVS